MGIFDKILRKEEKTEKPEEKKQKPEIVKVEKKSSAEKVKTTEVEKPKKETAKRKVAKRENNIAHKVLLENLISEKSTMLAAGNKYVFRVHLKSGKREIKEAVEGYYGVQVVGVNTIRINPKKRIQGRTIGWKKGYKKAIVTLREGDTIGAVEGV